MSPQRPDVQIFALQVYAIYIGFHIYFTFLASLFELSKLVIWFLSLLLPSRSFYAGLQPVLSLVSIIDTVPLENRFLYKDGLHLSDLGLDKQCRIILSILYRKLAPELKRERTKRKSNSTKHRPRT